MVFLLPQGGGGEGGEEVEVGVNVVGLRIRRSQALAGVRCCWMGAEAGRMLMFDTILPTKEGVWRVVETDGSHSCWMVV